MRVAGCTASRIGGHWALTALHCTANGANAKGTGVHGFLDATGPSSSQLAIVAADPKVRQNTDAVACEGASITISVCDDSDGDVADVALLALSDEAATGASDTLDRPQAVMAWKYPEIGTTGLQVGTGANDLGNHGQLLQMSDTLDDDSDSDGEFSTAQNQTDHGDSGGPFYVDNKILGDLWGNWNPGLGTVYTSTEFHLDWILTTIGYHWPGSPPISNLSYAGTVLDTLFVPEQVCQYACEHTSNCDGYDYNTTFIQQCRLLSGSGSPSAATGVHGALRWGQTSGSSGIAMGYDRGDGHSVVLHRTNANALNEIMDRTSGPTPSSILPSSAARIGGAVSGYRRADGTSAFVYRGTGTDGTVRVNELTLSGSSGFVGGVMSFSAPVADSDPVAYRRADGVSAVVYKSGSSIIEIRRGDTDHTGATADLAFNLTTATGCAAPTSPPNAFARSDGFSSVVYIGGGQVRELFKTAGGQWGCGTPSGVAGAPAPNPSIAPYGFTRFDGKNAIVYVSTTGAVIELVLGSTWTSSPISGTAPASIGTPIGIVRSDGTDSVFYRTGASIWEIHKGVVTNLSATMGLPNAATNPSAFVRLDGVTSVVFTGSDNRITELTRGPFDANWSARNLSNAAGEIP